MKESQFSDPITPPLKSPEFEYYDPPTPTPSPLSSALSSPQPSPRPESPKVGAPRLESPIKDSPKQEYPGTSTPVILPPKPVSPEQPGHTPSKKRKVEEVADSQDEDSEGEPWADEATLSTNQP